MFLEDEKFLDSGYDEIIRDLLATNNDLDRTIEEVAGFWDIYQDGKPPCELGAYIQTIERLAESGETYATLDTSDVSSFGIPKSNYG